MKLKYLKVIKLTHNTILQLFNNVIQKHVKNRYKINVLKCINKPKTLV